MLRDGTTSCDAGEDVEPLLFCPARNVHAPTASAMSTPTNATMRTGALICELMSSLSAAAAGDLTQREKGRGLPRPFDWSMLMRYVQAVGVMSACGPFLLYV